MTFSSCTWWRRNTGSWSATGRVLFRYPCYHEDDDDDDEEEDDNVVGNIEDVYVQRLSNV